MAVKIIILGGSAAGAKAASRARRLDQGADITIIEKSPVLSAAACGYPFFIGGLFDDYRKLVSTPLGSVRDPQHFLDVKNIHVLINIEATRIIREEKRVVGNTSETGEPAVFSYDKLILAMGSTPIRLELPGAGLEGITPLHNLENARYIKEMLGSGAVSKAVVIGGGLIGIETAEALCRSGLDVCVIEKSPRILPFLDPEISALVENHMRAKGCRILTGMEIAAFFGDEGRVKGVRLDNNESIECGLCVTAVGVRPESRLAKEAGLALGKSGGIIVDSFMRTSDPDIYAAGDCVETTSLIDGKSVYFPMGDAANLQGRAAGENAVCGDSARFNGVVMTRICKAFDYSVGITGFSETSMEREGRAGVISALHSGLDRPAFMGAQSVFIKMTADMKTGKLLGVQAVGAGDVAKRLAMAAMALTAHLGFTDLLNLDLPYAPPYSQAIDNLIAAAHVLDNKYTCRMSGISCREVKERGEAGDEMFLLDVREPIEHMVAHLGIGEVSIPLGDLRKSVSRLPDDKNTGIVTICMGGQRAYEAARFLESCGYGSVKVMEGGISGWTFSRAK